MWVSYVNGTPTHSKRDTKNVTNWPPYLWNHPFKTTIYYAKCCMSPSLNGTLPESVIPQEITLH